MSFKTDFTRGLKDVFPMMLAYAPISALYGALAVTKGFTPVEAVFMSAVIYSGTAQFVLLDLAATATPIFMLIVTVAVLSLRHVLMSASISRHIGGFSKLRATGLLFWLTDEAWAIIESRAQKDPITPAYFFGAAMPIWPTWFTFTGIGAFGGSFMGDGRAIGLDFAFAAMFIAVVAGFWKGPRTGIVLAASIAASVAAKLYVPGAWYIILGGVAGMVVAALSWREQDTA